MACRAKTPLPWIPERRVWIRRPEPPGRLDELAECSSKAQKFGMVNRMGAHVRARVYGCAPAGVREIGL